ncbi:MAG TPA: zf-HC2 domain-containing protein [Solirubrobacteraceae bacterium]|nr:zf-HC2 domain-containing protein [Solirubrobacteraceae bacterium]
MNELLHRARFRRDHRWATTQMSPYLDGELGVTRTSRMERHVKECAECRALLAGLRRMLSALQRLPPPAGGAEAIEIVASVRVRLGGPPAPGVNR